MRSIEAVEQCCRDSLRQPELEAVAAALARRSLAPSQCLAWLRQITEVPASQDPITDLRRRLVDRGDLEEEGHALERYLLLLAAVDSLPAIPSLPVSEGVRDLIHRSFLFLAEPDARSLPRFRCGGADFASMCKVATLRRFPAGQFEWELSGIPRSWLLKVAPGSIPRLLRMVAFEMGGVKPMIFPHFTACGPRRVALREGEVRRAFFRMAVAMEMQPGVRGFLAAAWFLSPDALEINPQLSWLLPIFLENGGFATTMGETDLGVRQLGTNVELRRRYEAGEFRPRLGVVVWPRKAMLRWAARNPELADPVPAPLPHPVHVLAPTAGQ